MTPADMLEVIKMLLPAVAAWASVKASIAVALRDAQHAKQSADKAHQRIDALLTTRRN